MNVLVGDRLALCLEHHGNPKEKRLLLRKCFAWITRYIFVTYYVAVIDLLVIESCIFYDLSKSKHFNNIKIVLRLGLAFVNTILRGFTGRYSIEMR